MSSYFDFATKKPVDILKPEEKVRQQIERIIVNDFGYPKRHLDIEVPVQMGASSKKCDIAIFNSKKQSDIIGIVEAKQPGSSNGIKQLESYMSAIGTCKWGIWTNGTETRYAKKSDSGAIQFPVDFLIPKYGEKLHLKLTFDDLVESSNLKWVFRHINAQLYANTNLPRTEKQGAEMVRLIFCKLTDEYQGLGGKNGKSTPDFQVYPGEKGKDLRKRIDSLWNSTVSTFVGSGVFSKGEKITIDDYSLMLIVKSLQQYSLLKTDKDVVGDAFEIFAEKQFAGEKGQFFTPRNVVRMVVEMIDPQLNEKIIDPACGSGGFLISAYNYMTEGLNSDTKSKIAQHSLHGIDKDSDLVKICKAQMSIIGDGKSNITQGDTLNPESGKTVAEYITKQKFDVVITNPPFGSKIKIEKNEVLRKFDLAHHWKTAVNVGGGACYKQNTVKKTPPQTLFIEQCLKILKPGGRMGIVLPDGILGNTGDNYIRQYIDQHANVLAVVDCPTETFMPHTGTKTSVIILQKKPCESETTFFAISENCGHTMRGNPTDFNDFKDISQNYKDYLKFGSIQNKTSHLGFLVNRKLDQNRILVPKYYDPRINLEIENYKSSKYSMKTIGQLKKNGTLTYSGTGVGPGAKEYDIHGTIRFIRTSDILGFELEENTLKKVSLEVYETYKKKQDLQIGDILFIKDGDHRIGDCAILNCEEDVRISVQSHFYKIRPVTIDPFLLLWSLNTTIVKKQIRQRVFNQSTLSTIGERISELRLPIPKDSSMQRKFSKIMKESISSRKTCLSNIRNSLV